MEALFFFSDTRRVKRGGARLPIKITPAILGFRAEPNFSQHKTKSTGASTLVGFPEAIVLTGFRENLFQKRTDVRCPEFHFGHDCFGAFQRDETAAFRDQQVRVGVRACGCAARILQERIHT